MLQAIAHFDAEGMGDDIHCCNDLIRSVLGPGFILDASCLPDLVMLAKDSDQRVVAMMTLHYTEGTHAWEIGNLLVLNSFKRDSMSRFLMDSVCSFIRVKYGNQHRAWLVQRVKVNDEPRMEWMRSVGFERPEKWMHNVLSDEGFVPFDPFDHVLMKRRVFI